MPLSLANWIVILLAAYAAVGAAFAAAFVTIGVDRVDPAARRSGWGFRLIIVPGTIALWPLLMLRWAGRREPAEERNAHRDAVRGRDS